MKVRAKRVRGETRDRSGRIEPAGAKLWFTGLFAPGESSEDHDQRESSTTTATIYTHEIGLDIVDLDRIETPAPVAASWKVDGEPQQWLSPYTGLVKGMVIRLRKTRG